MLGTSQAFLLAGLHSLLQGFLTGLNSLADALLVPAPITVAFSGLEKTFAPFLLLVTEGFALGRIFSLPQPLAIFLEFFTEFTALLLGAFEGLAAFVEPLTPSLAWRLAKSRTRQKPHGNQRAQKTATPITNVHSSPPRFGLTMFKDK
ncbi:MAG: hypothetical protein JSU88_03835 [Nitrospinaceae bacterium]|nr:MAG: hypothetical protein JSU88_03835 [Nitrospinaceae bacterium]